MSTPSDAMTDIGPDAGAERAGRAAVSPLRAFGWSVRRELWENGSFWIAPLCAAGVVLFGCLIALGHLPSRVPAFKDDHGVRHNLPAVAPYLFAAFVIFATALITGIFYCLGALHNERRDRTILFWKSLPVSDVTTVLAKAFMPLAVLPVVAFVILAATQLIILAMNAAAAATGSEFAASLTQLPVLSLLGLMAYGVVVLALWYAPVWGWCLLVGAWARRAPFLWAAGVPLALCVVEAIAFQTSFAWRVVHSRLDPPPSAFQTPAHRFEIDLSAADPAGFLADPGLWLGLVFAAACMAAAVWVRRTRDPI